MRLVPSLVASALVLSLPFNAAARFAKSQQPSTASEPAPRYGSGTWGILQPFHGLIGGRLSPRHPRDEAPQEPAQDLRRRQTFQDCEQDPLYYALSSMDPAAKQTFCNRWNNIPPTVTDVTITPTEYVQHIFLASAAYTLQNHDCVGHQRRPHRNSDDNRQLNQHCHVGDHSTTAARSPGGESWPGRQPCRGCQQRRNRSFCCIGVKYKSARRVLTGVFCLLLQRCGALVHHHEHRFCSASRTCAVH